MRRNAEEALQYLLDNLKNVQETPNGWNACCPAHDDNKQSLDIAKAEDGTLLINCKAGCTVPNICYAVGLTASELYPEPERSKKGKGKRLGRVVQEYQYTDETGNLRYQVVRMDPKDFRQRRPDGSGGWVWGLFDGYYYETKRGWFKLKKGTSPNPEHRHFPGCKRILYRLPDLIAADAAKPVYIVEGEKDVDRLWELGVVATCNVGGAGKWQKAYNESLVNRSVVVLADNDDPGRKHTQQVAESLQSVATVRIVVLPGLPEKGDVSDWLDSGRTLQEIEQITAQTPIWKSEDQPEPTTGTKELALEICNGIKDGEEVSPVCLEQIVAGIDQITGGWPRKAGGALFTCNSNHQIQWLNKTSDFYAYMGQFGPPPRFHRSAGCHTKEEVMSGWKWHCKSYNAIEKLPHEPRLQDHFYAHEPIEPGDGKILDEFLTKFNPETDLDLDLIKAMFATPLWGGRGGARPAFVITSDAGRGSGKSTIISLLAHLYGGMIDLSPREDIGVLKQRLLSTEALPLRIAVLDNVKTLRFSWGELESLITAAAISGKRLYVGEESRPNTLMYVITLNGVALSTDMAQRSVIIKLKRPKHAGAWEQETREFIDKYRMELLADLIAFLRSERVETLDDYSRWSAWEHAIVERLPVPGFAQSLYMSRQIESDVELEETEMIEEYVRGKLEELPGGYSQDHYNCGEDRIFIPSKILAKWYREISHKQESEIATIRLIKQRVKAGDFKCIKDLKGNKFGRGFLWVGGDAVEARTNPIKSDVESRMEQTKFY